MMAESYNKRDAVLKLYSANRTCIESNDKELLRCTHAHLANKTGDRRFPALHGVDLYRLLWRLTTHFDNPDPDTILKIKAGFVHLEQYALNLWRSPWRKEFHVIKTYTGFFKCKVERSLPDIPTAVSLIKCLGYKLDVESKDHLLLEEPLDTEKIQQVSFDLFLVTVDLQIVHDIAHFAEKHGYSLKQAIKARYQTVGGEDEAISWLRRQPKDESLNKKIKLDKDSGTPEEPAESVGHTSNESSGSSGHYRGERMLNGQGSSELELHEEASQSRPTSSDRETKFPPSFSSPYTRDISPAQYTYSSAFGSSRPHASVFGSTVNPGAVEPHKESELDHLTDDQLYGQGDHSTENHFPASEGVERVQASSSFSNGLTTGEQQNTAFSQELPQRNTEEALYVNISEMKTPPFTTSATEVGWNQGVREAPPPILSPGTPPPAYADALMLGDYVMIQSPAQCMEVDPVVTKNRRCSAGGLSEERTEVKGESYHGYDEYNPQLYQSKGHRDSDLSSINASISKTLNLDANSTSEATVRASSSEKAGDLDIKSRASMHRPGSGLTVPETERSKGTQRSESSSSREPPRSVSDKAPSTPIDEDRRRYQAGQYPSQGARDSKQDELLLQTRAAGQTRRSDRHRLVSGGVQTSLNTPKVTHCEICSLGEAGFICQSCFKMACEGCQEIFNKDLCKETNGPHIFVDVRRMESKKKKSSPKTWNCKRCTFVNPGEAKVCTMCSKTQGLSTPELPEPGSPVCRGCTFCNTEGSEVCAVCGRSLRIGTAETSV